LLAGLRLRLLALALQGATTAAYGQIGLIGIDGTEIGSTHQVVLGQLAVLFARTRKEIEQRAEPGVMMMVVVLGIILMMMGMGLLPLVWRFDRLGFGDVLGSLLLLVLAMLTLLHGSQVLLHLYDLGMWLDIDHATGGPGLTLDHFATGRCDRCGGGCRCGGRRQRRRGGSVGGEANGGTGRV